MCKVAGTTTALQAWPWHANADRRTSGEGRKSSEQVSWAPLEGMQFALRDICFTSNNMCTQQINKTKSGQNHADQQDARWQGCN